jgi:hypothetical protein
MLFSMGRSKDVNKIIDTINRIGITVDRHDWEGCLGLFIDEPEVDYSSFSGQPGGKIKSSDLINSWKNFLPGFNFTMHFITNHKISIHDDRAGCFSYIHAIHYIKNSEGGDMWGVYGTYEHELLKSGKNWKISKMKLNFKHQDGNLNLPQIARERMKQP